MADASGGVAARCDLGQEALERRGDVARAVVAQVCRPFRQIESGDGDESAPNDRLGHEVGNAYPVESIVPPEIHHRRTRLPAPTELGRQAFYVESPVHVRVGENLLAPLGPSGERVEVGKLVRMDSG